MKSNRLIDWLTLEQLSELSDTTDDEAIWKEWWIVVKKSISWSWIWYIKYYWCDLDNETYIYLWYKSMTSEKRRIRRMDRATQSYMRAKGDTLWQESWDNRTNLTYLTNL